MRVLLKINVVHSKKSLQNITLLHVKCMAYTRRIGQSVGHKLYLPLSNLDFSSVSQEC